VQVYDAVEIFVQLLMVLPLQLAALALKETDISNKKDRERNIFFIIFLEIQIKITN
jgi:hypothetical protein